MQQYINEFQASMNEHSGAEYKAFRSRDNDIRRPIVVEYERFHSRSDRARIVVWERPTENPRSNRWVKRVSKYGTVDEIEPIFREFDGGDSMRELIDEKND